MDKPLVLIVDGEALIRISAVHIVEDAGFSSLEASNADDTIKMLEERRDIRAVFTDINMSGSMDGWKLARAIRGRWPPVHLIVTSGSNMLNQEQLPVHARFISKPYTVQHLTNTLYELFGYNPAPDDFESPACKNRVKVA
jgi:CheY-like chemotaxis protein